MVLGEHPEKVKLSDKCRAYFEWRTEVVGGQF